MAISQLVSDIREGLEENPYGYTMGEWWNEELECPGCIGARALYESGYTQEEILKLEGEDDMRMSNIAAGILGLSLRQGYDLFFPDPDYRDEFGDVDIRLTISTLRHLERTGAVSWEKGFNLLYDAEVQNES